MSRKKILKLIAPIIWCAVGFIGLAILSSKTGEPVFKILAMLCWGAAVIFIIRGIGAAQEARKEKQESQKEQT